MREFQANVQTSYAEVGSWRRQSAVRLDFSKLAALADGGMEEEEDDVPPENWMVWDISASLSRIVFVRDRDVKLRVCKKHGRRMLFISPEQVVVDLEGEGGAGRFHYSTSNIDRLLHFVELGKTNLLAEGRNPAGVFFQSFVDVGLGSEDWVSLGFTPPTAARPAFDVRGDGKSLSSSHICVPYEQLDCLEESCERLWDNYVDSSYKGVYFSMLEVSRTVWSGISAGMAVGSKIFMSEDFLEGFPYRPAWNKFEAIPGGTSEPKSYSMVYHGSGQYIGFDSKCLPKSSELTVKWKTLGRCETGLFAQKGRYLPAKQIRSAYYVSPRARTAMVWEHGSPAPVGEKCLLSAGAGGSYTPRPCKGRYRYLVEKYGAKAVPRNFNKFKESEISRKSLLVENVNKGDWIYIPRSSDFDLAVADGYRKIGKKPLPWRILRQVHLPSEIEKDPFGNGLYAKLVAREDVFSSGERMRKMVRTMKTDGWDFLLEEIMEEGQALKRAIFSLLAD